MAKAAQAIHALSRNHQATQRFDFLNRLICTTCTRPSISAESLGNRHRRLPTWSRPDHARPRFPFGTPSRTNPRSRQRFATVQEGKYTISTSSISCSREVQAHPPLKVLWSSMTPESGAADLRTTSINGVSRSLASPGRKLALT